MEMVEIPVINRVDAMYIENGTARNVRVHSFSYYHQVDLFVITQQIEEPDILLLDTSLHSVTYVRAWLHIYGSDQSHGIFLENVCPGKSADDVTMFEARSMTVVLQVINKST